MQSAAVQALTEIKAVRQKLHKSGNRAAVTLALGRAERELRHQVAVSSAVFWSFGRGIVAVCLQLLDTIHSAINLLVQTFCQG